MMRARTPSETLNTLAIEQVRKHKNAERALKSFADAVWADKTLVRFLALPFLIAAEHELRSEAHVMGADSGCVRIGFSTQPEFSGVSHKSNVSNDHPAFADSAKSTTKTAYTYKGPTKVQIAAMIKDAEHSARSVFNTWKRSDGVLWGSSTPEDIDILLLTCARDTKEGAAIKRQLGKAFGEMNSKQRKTPISKLLSEKEMTRAKEASNAA